MAASAWARWCIEYEDDDTNENDRGEERHAVREPVQSVRLPPPSAGTPFPPFPLCPGRCGVWALSRLTNGRNGRTGGVVAGCGCPECTGSADPPGVFQNRNAEPFVWRSERSQQHDIPGRVATVVSRAVRFVVPCHRENATAAPRRREPVKLQVEPLEARTVPATYTLPLVNQTGLLPQNQAIYVLGYSVASNLFLDASGHFSDGSTLSSLPAYDISKLPNIFLDDTQQVIGVGFISSSSRQAIGPSLSPGTPTGA